MANASKDHLIVPAAIRRKAGIKPGDRLEFKVARRKITILATPEPDEYTPAQRSTIDRRLAQARKGPYHGPFVSVDEAMACIETDPFISNEEEIEVDGETMAAIEGGIRDADAGRVLTTREVRKRLAKRTN